MCPDVPQPFEPKLRVSDTRLGARTRSFVFLPQNPVP